WMRDLKMAPWDPLWAVGEQTHSRVRAYPAGKLALFAGDHPTGVSIPIVAYALEVGDLLLTIDSGLAPRWRHTPQEAPDDGPAPGMRYRPVLDGPTFAEQLHAEGLEAQRAVCTHLHVDHAGGTRQLGVPVEAAVKEIAAALSNESGTYPIADLDGVQFAPVRFDRGPVGPFPAHGELAPGVLALSTPGHTPGSISVFACLGGTWALICGDAAYPRADEPQSDAYLGMLRIRRTLDEIGGTLVLAGHDTAALRACADGAWLGT
ncbi:MAG: MBL fold metallo-hydrolase, partial [Candidatus Dormibacteria bacterium]